MNDDLQLLTEKLIDTYSCRPDQAQEAAELSQVLQNPQNHIEIRALNQVLINHDFGTSSIDSQVLRANALYVWWFTQYDINKKLPKSFRLDWKAYPVVGMILELLKEEVSNSLVHLCQRCTMQTPKKLVFTLLDEAIFLVASGRIKI